jgi:hypothetical protein
MMPSTIVYGDSKTRFCSDDDDMNEEDGNFLRGPRLDRIRGILLVMMNSCVCVLGGVGVKAAPP